MYLSTITLKNFRKYAYDGVSNVVFYDNTSHAKKQEIHILRSL